MAIKEIRCAECKGNAPVSEADHKKGKLPCPFCGATILLPYTPLFVYKSAEVGADVARFENRWRIEVSVREHGHKAEIDIRTREANGVRFREIAYNSGCTRTRRKNVYVRRSEEAAGESLAVTIAPGDGRELVIPVGNDTQERWLCNALRYILNEWVEPADGVEQRCSNCGAPLYRAAQATALVSCPFCEAGFVTHTAKDQPGTLTLPALPDRDTVLSKDVRPSVHQDTHTWRIHPRAPGLLMRILCQTVLRWSLAVQLLLLAMVATIPFNQDVKHAVLLAQAVVLLVTGMARLGAAVKSFFEQSRCTWTVRISDESLSAVCTHKGRRRQSRTINLSQIKTVFFSRNNTPSVHLVARSPIEELCVPFYLADGDSDALQHEIVSALKQRLSAAGRAFQ